MFLSFWYFGWFSGVLGLINDTLKMANNIIEIIIIIFTLLTRYDAKKTEKSAQIDGQGKFLWRDLAERKKINSVAEQFANQREICGECPQWKAPRQRQSVPIFRPTSACPAFLSTLQIFLFSFSNSGLQSKYYHSTFQILSIKTQHGLIAATPPALIQW